MTTWTRRGRQVVSRQYMIYHMNQGQLFVIEGNRRSKLGNIWSTQLLNDPTIGRQKNSYIFFLNGRQYDLYVFSSCFFVIFACAYDVKLSKSFFGFFSQFQSVSNLASLCLHFAWKLEYSAINREKRADIFSNVKSGKKEALN